MTLRTQLDAALAQLRTSGGIGTQAVDRMRRKGCVSSQYRTWYALTGNGVAVASVNSKRTDLVFEGESTPMYADSVAIHSGAFKAEVAEIQAWAKENGVTVR